MSWTADLVDRADYRFWHKADVALASVDFWC